MGSVSMASQEEVQATAGSAERSAWEVRGGHSWQASSVALVIQTGPTSSEQGDSSTITAGENPFFLGKITQEMEEAELIELINTDKVWKILQVTSWVGSLNRTIEDTVIDDMAF